MNRILFLTKLGMIFIMIIGCSDTSVDPEPEEPEDHISGIYTLAGTKIINKNLYPQGNFISSDTTQISFSFSLKLIDPQENRIQVFGLRGLNAGQSKVLPSSCENSRRYCAYVILKDSIIEFDFSEPGGKYSGTGKLTDGQIEIDTRYYYRGREFFYDLSGSKIK